MILYCLLQAQKEFPGRNVPTVLLYGRVVEHLDIDQLEFQSILSRMAGLTRDTGNPPEPGSDNAIADL